jgi:antitoxin component of MazEF toxin-antitoxin module
MNRSIVVKLQKVGNSQAVIIPSSFLKDVADTSHIKMRIEANEIRLVFESEKSLQMLIDEKRARNKGLLAKMMQSIEKLDLTKHNENYIINNADDLID